MSLIVAGTGTGVGKTFVSALLLHRYPGLAAYYKPVSTGSEPDTVTVRVLAPEGTLMSSRDVYVRRADVPARRAGAGRTRPRPCSDPR